MTCGRICVRNVDSIGMNEAAAVAARRMHARNVGTLVVIDGDQMSAGIVTDRDLVVRVLAGGLDPWHTTVRQAMSPVPATVSEETSIVDALRIMQNGPFRRILVLDSEQKLVGILSVDDVLLSLTDELTAIGKLLFAESPLNLARS
jgi:predicted transcriptional regulator